MQNRGTMNTEFTAQREAAHDVLFGHIASGVMMLPALRAAVSLRVAEVLAEGPRSVPELAQRLSCDPDALHRLLRFLAGSGVFVETEPHVFAQNHVSHFLRFDVPNSVAEFAVVDITDPALPAWKELAYSVRTGEASFPHVHGGVTLWEHLTRSPEARANFNRTVAGLAAATGDIDFDSYDFSGARVVADIGGGLGGLVTAILRAHPLIRGVLFDMPEVAEAVRGPIADSDVGARIEVVGGDFFAAVPPADVYMLRHVLHDWDDESCRNILRNCRRASPHARVLVVERVLSTGRDDRFTLMLDLSMLTLFARARERDRGEYQALFEAAGYQLRGVQATGTPFSILEGVPV